MGLNLLSTGRRWLEMLLRADKMLEAIVIFVAGLLCGIVAGRFHLRRQRKKIKFYESYIHGRLRDALPGPTKDLRVR